MEPPRQLDALVEDDVQVLRKTLLDVVPLTEDRDAEGIARAARSRLDVLHTELEPDLRSGIETLAQMLSDPDWVLPPSTRRYVGSALICFAEDDRLPGATATVLKQYTPGVLPGLLVGDLGPEIEGYVAFRASREKLRARRWLDEEGRSQRLLQMRRRLRLRIQRAAEAE
jgi:hypothetical protein